ncbi:hypothetical protein EBI_26769 [Enterocytozoon bieneusi H348]|nr:hypothetical protein EBI_26769 [Enterocytozoon bieneusi H348]|eukprot:XP_002651516.1 hypothetical protein EBI_26769 [Enterocytozoon bieneusi H348]
MEFIYDFLAGSSSQNIAADDDLSKTRDKSLRDTTAAYLWFCKKKGDVDRFYITDRISDRIFSEMSIHPNISSYNYIKQIKQDPSIN